MQYLTPYSELILYTLSLQDKEFIHQHVVDAYGAQNADENTKPIALFFSLAGLYLLIEKNFTGRQIQKAHQAMAAKTKNFIRIALPPNKGDIFIQDIMQEPVGPARNTKILEWCALVWATYVDQHKVIIEATDKLLL